MPAKKSNLITPKQLASLRKLDEELTKRREQDKKASNLAYAERHGNVKPIGEILKDVKPQLDQMLMSVQEKMRQHREKYTPLIHSLPQKEECLIHEGQFGGIDFEACIVASYRDDALKGVYFPCPECVQIRLVNEKFKKWLNVGVPRKTAHATFENFLTQGDPLKQKARERVSLQAKRGKGFCLMYGKKGTGKTHLATAALKFAGDGIFVTQGDMIGELRESYDSGGQEKIVAKYRRAKCLVIDEIDKDLGGGEDDRGKDITPFLYRILSYRYDHDLITYLTSNEDLDTLLAILGPRLEDRMAQNYITATFTWESYRRSNRTM